MDFFGKFPIMDMKEKNVGKGFISSLGRGWVAGSRGSAEDKLPPCICSVSRAVLLCVSIFLLTACYGSTMPDPGPRGTLRFQSNQKEAVLEVDETRLGPIGSFEKSGVLLRPGNHRIVVHRPGFFKEYKLIEVVENQLQMVEINLTPIPE